MYFSAFPRGTRKHVVTARILSSDYYAKKKRAKKKRAKKKRHK